MYALNIAIPLPNFSSNTSQSSKQVQRPLPVRYHRRIRVIPNTQSAPRQLHLRAVLEGLAVGVAHGPLGRQLARREVALHVVVAALARRPERTVARVVLHEDAGARVLRGHGHGVGVRRHGVVPARQEQDRRLRLRGVVPARVRRRRRPRAREPERRAHPPRVAPEPHLRPARGEVGRLRLQLGQVREEPGRVGVGRRGRVAARYREERVLRPRVALRQRRGAVAGGGLRQAEALPDEAEVAGHGVGEPGRHQREVLHGLVQRLEDDVDDVLPRDLVDVAARDVLRRRRPQLFQERLDAPADVAGARDVGRVQRARRASLEARGEEGVPVLLGVLEVLFP